MTATARHGRRIELQGTVQGLGVRPWVYRSARAHGVTGRVWNHTAGVTIEAFGTDATLDQFIGVLVSDPPAGAVISAIASSAIAADDAPGFSIVESARTTARVVSIPPDLATCDECLAEILDPANRRYRYPFTNCTHCGPRFTIATDVPYDRPATTMAPFVMCDDCRREYEDPGDRRFHAQPNACPVCGPRLTATAVDGTPLDVADPIRHAAAAIAAGKIVALKGIGGFHLACDATSADAILRLRLRKRRDHKPFAVMVRDAAAARDIAELSADELRLLESIERPIVLVPMRDAARGLLAAAEVSPNNPLIGLMLPYTPMHHLLLADTGVPLVMTSANIAEQPIVYRNDDAVATLGTIADLLLVHDREIVTRADDSVARVIGGAPMLMRRSRGFVPRAIMLPMDVAVPTLGCGAVLKNTFCLAHHDRAWLGPHIGDLENAETFDAYQDAIARMERFLGIRPELVAHDLHPDYLSTRYANARGLPAAAVQHHHAHVASAMAEHGLTRPVIGVAFDGTGYGTDGTAWGGEFLVGDYAAVERMATFRAVPLAGGDAAIRQPWRIALALIRDAYGDTSAAERLPLFAGLAASDVRVVEQMLAARLNAPLARGVGRYFDGIGALVLARSHAHYEGQIAFELNMAADPRERGELPYALDEKDGVTEIDLRLTVRGVVADLHDGVPASRISARFHNTLAAATCDVVRRISSRCDLGVRAAVVLTGGCFQNARLAEDTRARLQATHDVFLHQRVPPGDGGIALGQAVVAATSTALGTSPWTSLRAGS